MFPTPLLGRSFPLGPRTCTPTPPRKQARPHRVCVEIHGVNISPRSYPHLAAVKRVFARRAMARTDGAAASKHGHRRILLLAPSEPPRHILLRRLGGVGDSFTPCSQNGRVTRVTDGWTHQSARGIKGRLAPQATSRALSLLPPPSPLTWGSRRLSLSSSPSWTQTSSRRHSRHRWHRCRRSPTPSPSSATRGPTNIVDDIIGLTLRHSPSLLATRSSIIDQYRATTHWPHINADHDDQNPSTPPPSSSTSPTSAF
ncbi:hypothetical protein FB45DRAFT_893 [Roridomyces roridus]|uniref:Uncharacterized protein n=1 Tax=Roridomyces roridus TaxID=1738132 RepID=A0AAD7CIE5_9AGAR|nr:hypothetical protein FB45DRAFT_893 [Roridomyces roridus]